MHSFASTPDCSEEERGIGIPTFLRDVFSKFSFFFFFDLYASFTCSQTWQVERTSLFKRKDLYLSASIVVIFLF